MLNFPELDLSKKELLSEIRRLREINKELSYENQNLKNSLITIRKSLREKLQQQEDDNDEQFKLMIEAIPVSIVISKINGEILCLNKTAIQTFALPEEKLDHYNTNQFYCNTDDRKKIIKLFAKQGFVKNQEVQVKTSKGHPFWVNANIQIFKYKNQPALLSVLFDLSHLKKITAQKDILIDKYLDILYLFNLSLDLLCIANFEGYFVCLNPAWENILGYSLAELVTIQYLDLVHPEDQENTLKEVQKLTQGINTIEFENRYLCKDGSYRWFLWTATPVLETGLIYCVAHDITKRKKSEQNLHQSREEMRLITDNLPMCISYIDNQRRYLFINQTYETWFNHKKEEVIGKYLWDILGQEFYEQEAKKYVDQVLQGEQIRYETQITFAEGITRYVEGKLIPDYDENQQIRGYFCVITDLSDRRQQEELLRIAKENYQQIFENAS
jgi:PAS domain S-box-containing protein